MGNGRPPSPSSPPVSLFYLAALVAFYSLSFLSKMTERLPCDCGAGGWVASTCQGSQKWGFLSLSLCLEAAVGSGSFSCGT